MLTINSNNLSFGNTYTQIGKSINNRDMHSIVEQNLRVLGAGTYSGPTFEFRPIRDLKKLQEMGVTHIVDFRADATSKMGSLCKTIGLNYLRFPLDEVLTLRNPNYFYLDKNNKLKVTDKFVKELKTYFDIMDKENLYVGCQYGIDRTNIGLSLNYLLNPKTKQNAPEILTWPGERRKSIINKNIKVVKKILKALTPEQREYLGLSSSNNEYTNKQILKLLHKNHQLIDSTI